MSGEKGRGGEQWREIRADAISRSAIQQARVRFFSFQSVSREESNCLSIRLSTEFSSGSSESAPSLVSSVMYNATFSLSFSPNCAAEACSAADLSLL